MIADNYILENDNIEDYTNKFSEKKIYEINDNNGASYSNGHIKYQLSQLFNLNSVMNFKEALLIIPFIINFKITGAAASLTAEDIRKLVSIKSGSLISGIRLRINGKTVVSYDSNLNEIMEFNFLTSCISGNTNEWNRSMNCLLEDKYLTYKTADTELLQYQKYYNNKSLSNSLINDIEIENNKLLLTRDGLYESLNDINNAIMEKQNYVETPVSNSTNLKYYVAIKLSQIHDVFEKMGISRSFVDFELDCNVGKSEVSCAVPAVTTPIFNLNDTVKTQTHTFNGATSSIYFNLDGVERKDVTKVWWDNAVQTSKTVKFEATLSIDNTAGTKLYMPVYKIKPEFNELYIKDSVKTIKYNDYLYYNLNNITSGSSVNFTISNAVSNLKYLLMVPQLLKNKLNCLNQSTLANGPIPLSNLQLQKGSAVFNQPLVYNYDMFLNYIENNNNTNGGKDWVNNLFNFNNFNKLYRLYFFDLTLINNQKDVAYNLTVQFVNKCKLAINVDFYVFEEKELIFNKINGVIGDVQ